MSDESGKKDILIVEDNAFNALFLSAALDFLEAVCDIAENGCIALEMAERKKYDLIFMDCQMPVMDGYEVAARIKKLEPPFCEVPIIALTANGTREAKEKCRNSGMDDCLVKPVELNNLEEIFKKFFSCKEEEPKSASKPTDTQERPGRFDEAVERLMHDLHLSPSQAGELMEEYRNTSSEMIKKMEGAFTEGRYDELAGFAHQMKGVASNLRLKEFQDIIAEIEGMSKEQNENLEEELNRLKIMIREF